MVLSEIKNEEKRYLMAFLENYRFFSLLEKPFPSDQWYTNPSKRDEKTVAL